MSTAIQTSLTNFQALPLKDAARELLATLGYKSDKFLAGAGSQPQDFLDDFAKGHTFDETKALVSEWKTADLLFQLTDQELSRESALFTNDSVQRGLLRSYVFIAIELKQAEYPRSKFSDIARQINRLFPMPVMVVFKHADRLTIAVINRRRNKLDDSKDVLEKATLIRDISLTQPHRGHLDILSSLALAELKHPQKLPITDFDTLHAAWEQIFNVDLLNERFYRELANWYFWALPQVEFPADVEKDDEKRRATGLIRLLTRLMFCWFLKEKGLIPENLFHPTELGTLLKGFDPESETSSTFYQAILQNLFFATLNQRMGNDSNGKPYRAFATDEGFPKNRSTYDINNLYRYEQLFAVSQQESLDLFADIPFLNGGLFECLDRTEEGTNKKLYLDGFSRNAKMRPHVPDRLFFDSGETADLSEVYGDKKRKAEKVTGLIAILNRYKFTIVENTPIDQEIALDPELLGKVFENLLASYNEETKKSARKQTGSFYTPRPIVDYMVDESLKAHLTRCLTDKAGMKEDDAKAGLDILFAYTEKELAFNPVEVNALITAIDEVKILDPACGSGAFPMGVLHKLVYILGKLDPDNDRWKQTQLSKLDSPTMREELERAFADNNDDYGRKLYLIENCLYGVDIQPIAIQISKLRFFISLVCDQKTNRSKNDNHGIRPLPNLETKFVAADTLIGLPKEIAAATTDVFVQHYIEPLEREIAACYHRHFSLQNRKQKLDVQKEIKELRGKIAEALIDKAGIKGNAEIVGKARAIADWDPFDPQATANFFDPQWMFGASVKDGFDVVIGNPPYGASIATENIKRIKKAYKLKTTETAILFIERGLDLLKPKGYQTYIIPKSFCFASNYHTTRHFLLDDINRLVDCGKAFDNVKLEACIIGVEKGSYSQEYRSLKYDDDYSFSILGNINKSLVNKFGIMPNGLNAAEIALGKRIRDTSRLLGELSVNYRGEMFQKELEEIGTHKVIGGKEIDRYGIRRIKGYISDQSLITDKARIHPSSILAQNIVAHITKPHDHITIIACLPQETDILVVDTINQITLKDSSIQREFVWCLFASKLVNWYCYNFILAKAIRTIHFDNSFTSKIPVPSLSFIEQQPYIEIAKEICRLKATDANARVKHLETKIDLLLYQHYNLAQEEIIIVEGAVK